MNLEYLKEREYIHNVSQVFTDSTVMSIGIITKGFSDVDKSLKAPIEQQISIVATD